MREERLYLLEGAEAAEAVEGGDGDGHLGFVVVICVGIRKTELEVRKGGGTGVVLGVLGAETLGEFFVGVGLDGEGFLDREDFEEEGEGFVEALGDGEGEEGLVLGDHVEEGAPGLYIFGGVGGVRSHP